jgi:glutathione synthase/RimK-type ligase-like ATP-grasp enzyme
MRILVTYGWCRTSYVICESLARAGFTVHTCGDSALCMTRVSRYVHSFDRVPDPFGDPRCYAAAVGDVMRRRAASVVIPAHEDFVALQQFQSLLPAGAIVAAPDAATAGEALDKWALVQRAKRAHIPVPDTYGPQSLEEAHDVLEEIEYPAIIKPRHGNGGKGVVRVDDPQQGYREYRRIVNRFQLSSPILPLIQEYIPGEQVGSCFMAINGILQGCFIERYVRCKQAGFGTSVLREPAKSEGLREYTARLCSELKWTGIGHLDFIVSAKEHRPYLLEMNPRFWGALNLAVKNGFDFPRALVSWVATGNVDACAFAERSPVSSLWIAGELMACVDDMKRGRWRDLLRSPGRLIRARCYDDFRLADPLPFVVELAYYLTGFVRAGGDVNPVTMGMINRPGETIYDPASH